MAENHDDPKTVFATAVSGVRRLIQDRIAPFKPRPRPVAQQARRERDAVLASLLTFTADDIDVGTGEELLFRRNGISKSILRNLQHGHFAIERELDLHGLTVAQARIALAGFLHEAIACDVRCVRIIHGKGLRSAGRLPILKGCTNSWLRQKDEVLAFCSSRPTDGGTGAVYVLLKRH
ncbi:MAG: Smr/MutS family protein [Acidiferrobacter sp.]